MVRLGIVYEIRKNRAVVLTPNYEFLEIKRTEDMYIGQQVKFNIQDVRKTMKPVYKYVSIVSSIAAIFVLVFLYLRVPFYGQIYGYINVDINPSVEFIVDKEFEVLQTKALNNDAKKIVKELDAEGKDAYSVINDFLDKCEEYGYIIPQEDNIVLVSASIDDSNPKTSKINQDTELDNFLTNLNERFINQNKENIKSRVVKVSPQEREAALKNNLSMGKYYLIERAKAKGIDISAEGLEQENIWDLFTAIDEKWDLIAQEPTANNQTPEPQERVTTPAAQTPPESTEEPTFEPTVNPTSKPKKEPPEPPAKPKDKEKVVVDTPKPKPESPGKPGAKGKEPVDAVKEGALEIELLSRKKDEKCQIIESDFKIINTSGKDIDLKKVKIRYYFTREGRANLEPAVYTYSKQNIKDKNYFKQKNTQDVKISFHKVSDSNMYMEIKFASGVLKKDEYVYIMTGFNNDKWDRMDQTNDYSYIADSNDFEVTQKVTGYISDKLVWGIEPY